MKSEKERETQKIYSVSCVFYIDYTYYLSILFFHKNNHIKLRINFTKIKPFTSSE
ncbi:hypothetical protein PEDI_38000 [Persicobacter diffluens]|uniref:Uncharacterized protein n=1 Tax=Persicobacter diffluens TaxID=981 RepID=A0AAN4W0R4_9BACT|nr:hypothetical protein PEDI_38000 [Persicobacter diffluens]